MNRKINVLGKACPCCGSSHTQAFKPGPSEQSLIGNFRVIADKKCQNCNAIWSPPAPRWLAIVSVFVGVVVVVVVASMVVIQPTFYQDGSVRIFQNIWGSIGSAAGGLMGLGVAFAGIKSFLSPSNQGVLRYAPNEKQL